MNKHDSKLERFAEREFRKNMESLIVPDDQGGLIMFGRYHLVSESHSYKVYGYSDLLGEFSSKKVAVSWCVAEKYRQYKLSKEIEILDRKRTTLFNDITCRQIQAKQSRSETFAETVNTKIEPKIISLNSINRELEKCLNSAKYLQIRGFNNET